MRSGFLPLLLSLLLCGAPAVRAGEKPPLVVPVDILYLDRVEGPLTAAGITRRMRADPPALFLWDLMADVQTLTDAQLRTLVHDFFRTWRYYRDPAPADSILLDAWAERDLAAATADILRIADWEDSMPWIGDYDSDVETTGSRLWLRLACQDWPRAREIAASLRGEETSRQFSGYVSFYAPAGKFAEYIAVCQANPSLDPLECAASALGGIKEADGPEAARAAARTLPPGDFRTAVEEALEKDIHPGDKPAPAARRPEVRFPDATLDRLAALETGMPHQPEAHLSYPWALVREIRKLPPETAAALARNFAQSMSGQKANPLPWLGWALCMRAAEGDPHQAAVIARCMPPFVPDNNYEARRPYSSLAGAAFALAASQTGTEDLLRTLPEGEDRNAAVRGFLARADISRADHWLALGDDLRVPPPVLLPLLVRMAAAGQVEKAMEVARRLSWDRSRTPAQEPTRQAIMETWTLHDLPAAAQYVSKLPPEPANQWIAFSFVSSLVLYSPDKSLPVLTGDLLQHLEDLGVYPNDPWMAWLPVENPAAVSAWLERYPGNRHLGHLQSQWNRLIRALNDPELVALKGDWDQIERILNRDYNLPPWKPGDSR